MLKIKAEVCCKECGRTKRFCKCDKSKKKSIGDELNSLAADIVLNRAGVTRIFSNQLAAIDTGHTHYA
jgi:hypothetical protein